MPLPHQFVSGEIARSAEVNANFAYIMSILGNTSTPTRTNTATEFQVGARANTLLTGKHDTGSVANEFFQMGWNADWNLVSGKWKFARFLSNKAASAIRLGPGMFGVWLTSGTTGDLNAQMRPVFKIQATDANPNTDYIYVPTTWSFQTYDGEARDIGDYRLNFQFLPNVSTIYSGAAGSAAAATAIKQATNFGIPYHAKAIAITSEITGGTSAGRVRFYQKRSEQSIPYGFTVSAAANQPASGFGFVRLGTGSYKGEFVIERTAQLAFLSAYIVGYLI
jgi:hypothetical protein